MSTDFPALTPRHKALIFALILAHAGAASWGQEPALDPPWGLREPPASNAQVVGAGQPAAAQPPSQGGAPGPTVYVDTGGISSTNRDREIPTGHRTPPPEPPTDLQRLAFQSTGERLPIFGRNLFEQPPSTFAPDNQTPAAADHVIGPGDEILVRLAGHDAANERLTVDKSGAIYIPQVGTVYVAGTRFGALEDKLNAELKAAFRNYHFSVSLGQLRSIQIFVVGEAQHPGAYTVSSLSTILNAVFSAGGPTPQGSMRHIQVLRGGKNALEFDLYDLVLRGDKSKDAPLQPSDVIFIPPVRAEVAVAGSVRHPAIYEVDDRTSLAELLRLAGGPSATASGANVSLERIEDRRVRTAISVKLDGSADATTLHDGDILFVNSVSGAFEKSVTIRGNLANPGRFAWRPGMRLSDLIPERASLLTKNYWRVRNQLGVPLPLFEPVRPMPGARYDSSQGYGGQDYASQDYRGQDYGGPQYGAGAGLAEAAADRDVAAALGRNNPRASSLPTGPGTSSTRSTIADQQQSVISGSVSRTSTPIDVQVPVPEIDWSYAVIERLDPNTLKSVLVPFNLGKLVEDHDASQDLPLDPGDVVTILSQADVHVGQDEQTKYVRLEGEFVSAGTYSTLPNETLQDLVRRSGGLTNKAYLFGAAFSRESARVMQQERLDEYISELAVNIERSAAARSASLADAAVSSAQYAEEQALIGHLRQMRATGRVVLEFKPDSSGVESIHNIPLEDGDVFRVPSRPVTVSVVGSVYGQNIYLWDAARRVGDYLKLAGKPNRYADRKHAFLIRADGSILSRDAVGRSFDSSAVSPGDTIVVPEKQIKPSAIRNLADYTQVFSQLALGAAAINVVH